MLPNVTIGPNSIVGAGSVVTKNIPSDSVAVGNPAKTITSVSEYIKKIEAISKDKKVFGKDYYIENMDKNKRREITKSIGNSIGFIL